MIEEHPPHSRMHPDVDTFTSEIRISTSYELHSLTFISQGHPCYISKISYWNHTWRYFMSQTRRRGNKSNTKIKKIYFGDLQNMSRKRIFVNLSFNMF